MTSWTPRVSRFPIRILEQVSPLVQGYISMSSQLQACPQATRMGGPQSMAEEGRNHKCDVSSKKDGATIPSEKAKRIAETHGFWKSFTPWVGDGWSPHIIKELAA